MEPKDQWQNAWLQRAQTSLGWSLGAEAPGGKFFEFGMVKNGYIGTSLKLIF